MNSLTLGSLFDGSGGFPLAGLLCGITPVWASEIEPFPIRVTTKKLPFMKHYGDINRLNGAEIEPVDIITFGSPCTDLSISGKRAGLNGKASSLFFEAIRIIKEMRSATNDKYPRFIVFENVPGMFSSGVTKGSDFKTVLEKIVHIKDEGAIISVPEKEKWLTAGEIVGDSYSIVWRVLDAQYFGVPQRRRRVYLIADFADECAGKILFESEGVPGDSPQSFESWERTPRTAENSTGNSSCYLTNAPNISHIAIENHSSDSRVKISKNNIFQSLTSTMGTGGNNGPMVIENRSVVYGICSLESKSMLSDNPRSGFYKADTSRTIDKNGVNPSCNQGGMAVISVQKSMIKDKGVPLVNTPKCNVRRLTPTECALLQGFPADWCDNLETPEPSENEIDWWAEIFETHRKIIGKSHKPKSRNQIIKWLRNPHSDSAEYKMWGNGVALPCVYFVLSRILAHA